MNSIYVIDTNLFRSTHSTHTKKCSKMSNQLFYANLVLAFYLSCHYALAQTENFPLPLKAVNLGNWFVIEGWMKPSLFDGITNNDLLVCLIISITYYSLIISYPISIFWQCFLFPGLSYLSIVELNS